MPEIDDELVWKGEWTDGADYDAGDAVYLGSTAYVSLQEHTAATENAPPNAEFWDLLAPLATGGTYGTISGYLHFSRNSDDGDAIDIARDLNAVSRLWERETGQYYTKDAEPDTRLFKVRRSSRIDLDYEGNCPGLASRDGLELVINGTTWSEGDYDLYPLQADKGPEPKPWTTIRPKGSKAFSIGADVEVTGIFGWPNVPEFAESWVYQVTAIWRRECREASLDDAIGSSPAILSLVKRVRGAYRKLKVG